jgi:hypothetical protein
MPATPAPSMETRDRITVNSSCFAGSAINCAARLRDALYRTGHVT